MTTVRELIKHLSEVKNQDEPVLYQFYLSEHFLHYDIDSEVWASVVKEFDSLLPNLDEIWLYAEIGEAIRRHRQSRASV